VLENGEHLRVGPTSVNPEFKRAVEIEQHTQLTVSFTMHFNAFFASLALAASFALLAKADTIVAFSGSSCDGDVGATVQCDGSCHQFGGRHSLRVRADP
jgi:nucleotidyltransferase/DNA polymerase involved in DNA repair